MTPEDRKPWLSIDFSEDATCTDAAGLRRALMSPPDSEPVASDYTCAPRRTLWQRFLLWAWSR